MIMGKKCDLNSSEKATITRELANGKTTLQIAAQLVRDHRTIKKHVANASHIRCRRDKGVIKSVDRKEITVLKRSLSNMPMSTSKEVFLNAGINLPSRPTRCKILKNIGNLRKPKALPPITKAHKQKRLEWAKMYMKLDFKRVIFSDECRATLDGPDGFCRGWLREGHSVPYRLRRQQGGGGVLFWAAIHGSNLIGPYKVDDGVKMNSKNYCDLLQEKLLPYLRCLPQNERRKVMFMQDNAPSHASQFTKAFLQDNGFSGNKLMDWPAASPDLNPIENFWSLFKQKLYANGKQFSNKTELWHGITTTFAKMDKSIIPKLIGSMDNRVVSVIRKNGNYINH